MSGEEANSFGPNVREHEDGGISINEGGNARPKGSITTSLSKRKASGIDSYFPPRTTHGAQPSIKEKLLSREKWRQVDLAVARFFYDCCIPFNCANSLYYQQMIDAIASIGVGYEGPNYEALRVKLLGDVKNEVRLLIESYRSVWTETGCTIMGDGWSDGMGRCLINFLVYCPKGISFIKSVDVSNFASDAQALCNLFSEIVDMVGAKNVIHLVTNNASNYEAAGRLLYEKYVNIFWSPCAAHCLNSMLQDISKLPHVTILAQRASKVTMFVYNYKWPLNWLRRRSGWTEILFPGETRFSTIYIALKSLYDHKLDLQALVTCAEYSSRLPRSSKAKEVKEIIIDTKFWNDCLVIAKIVGPLLRMLRIVDSNEKPSLGYVYEGMYRARKEIKELFKNKKRLYKPYTQIVKERWDRRLRKSIHAAAYWLNPAFQYDQASFCQKPEVLHGLLNVIESKIISGSKTKLLEETTVFRERVKGFGRELALTSCKNIRPDEWWRWFGHDCPNLKKLAIKLLSQTSSSSGCERNQSVFERIHTKRRNRLEHQKLSDLVYVHYNLRLKNRLYDKKMAYDPIDIDCVEKVDFWVIDEEPEGELDYDDLEDMLHNEQSANANIPRIDGHRDNDIYQGLDFSSFREFENATGIGCGDQSDTSDDDD